MLHLIDGQQRWFPDGNDGKRSQILCTRVKEHKDLCATCFASLSYLPWACLFIFTIVLLQGLFLSRDTHSTHP